MPTNTVVGSARAVFTISLVAAATEEVRVDWATKDGTAIAGRDYETSSGTVTFAPGETLKTVEVFVHGRAVETEDRVFYVLLDPPVNALLADEVGACVIHVDTAGTVPVMTVIIPRGEKGLTGDSAYQIALNNGFVGTQPEWLESLKPSPAEIAVLVAPLINAGEMLVTADQTAQTAHPDTKKLSNYAARVAHMAKSKVAFAPPLTAGANLVPLSAFVGDAVNPLNFTGFSVSVFRSGIATPIEFVYRPLTGEISIAGAIAGDIPVAIERDIGSGNVSNAQVAANGASKSMRDWIEQLLKFQDDLSDDADPEKGATLVGGAVRRIDNIDDLLRASSADRAVAVVSSYSPGWAATAKGAQGGGLFTWDSERLKSEHNGIWVFSNTVPWDGTYAGIASFQAGAGETSPGGKGCWVRIFNGPVMMEMAGVTGEGDEGVLMQRAISACYAKGMTLEGHGSYTSSTELTVPTYRTEPPVYRDFNRSSLFLNKLTFTGTSGKAVFVGSPTAAVHIRRLLGPGNQGVLLTDGLFITGLGDGHHRVDWVGGFTNGVNFNESYSNSLDVGWVEDCVRGIRINGNENKINGGHIGGSYTTSGINPLSCEIGIDIQPGSASNRITSNVEYCRRSINSIGINDRGVGTRFYGYTESCSSLCINAIGKDGYFEVLIGGTNVATESSGYHAGDRNHIHFIAQTDYVEALIDGGNATLAFMTLQRLSQSGSGKITGDWGFSTVTQGKGVHRNEIIDSSSINSANWARSALGNALWSNVSVAPSTSTLTDAGYRKSTRLVIPASPGETDIYRVSQGGMRILNGNFCYGVFCFVEEGEVDIMVRAIYAESTYQAFQPVRLSKSDAYFRVGSDSFSSLPSEFNGTFEISFRSLKGATIRLNTAYLMNRVGVEFPPDNNGARRALIGGSEVKGNTFSNGIAINGKQRGAVSPLMSAPFTLNGATIDYEVYLVTGGPAANITLEAGENGDKVTIKRDGVAGTINILPSGTSINGSTAIVNIAAWQGIRLQYSEELGTWLSL